MSKRKIKKVFGWILIVFVLQMFAVLAALSNLDEYSFWHTMLAANLFYVLIAGLSFVLMKGIELAFKP